MAATVVDFIGGGDITSLDGDLATDWSLTAGNELALCCVVNSADPTPFSLSPTLTSPQKRTETTDDDTGNHLELWTGVVASSGVHTATIENTTADRWTLWMAEVSGGAYLASGSGRDGPFDPTIDLAASSGMSGNDGVGLGFAHSNGDGNITIDPWSDVEQELTASGFRLSTAFGYKAMNNAATLTISGDISGGGINRWHAAWVLYSAAGGGATGSLLVPRRRQPHQRGLITHPRRFR